MTPPRPDPESRTLPPTAPGDVSLHYWEWPAAAHPPAAVALFCHATGFHGRLWDQIIHRLPSDWRCLALDHRGHGRSQAPAGANAYAWDRHVADVERLVAALGLQGALGVGHSMGGAVVAAVAGRDPAALSALLLVEPVIVDHQDPARRAGPSQVDGPSMAESARRRRPAWPSPEAMFESLAARPLFAAWDRQTLADYCRYALLPPANAGAEWPLACRPEVEAATFDRAMAFNPWPLLARITAPITLLVAGGRGGAPSTTSPRLAAALADARTVVVPEADHFLPMQRPDLVAAELVALAARRRAPSPSLTDGAGAGG